MKEDSKFKPHLPILQKYHDWSFLLIKVCGGSFLVEDGECLVVAMTPTPSIVQFSLLQSGKYVF
ncbi:MAG: hypothetical protein ACI89D_002461 [Bermanella sp.]|jgi:hypothetical protein